MKRTYRKIFLIIISFCSLQSFGQLSGTYTINPSGSGSSNYTNFTNAINALISSGVSGPVVFDISSGTYTEKITIPSISGVSNVNTVTFQASQSNTNPVKLQYSAPASSMDYVIRMNGTSNITFKGIKIYAAGSYYASIIQLNGVNSNISFIDNILEVNPSASTSTENNAFYYGPMSNSHVTGNWTFIGNTIINSRWGINLEGQDWSSAIDTCIISGNTIEATSHGLNISYAGYVHIKGNTVFSDTSSSAYPSALSNVVEHIENKLIAEDNDFLNCTSGFIASTTLPSGSTPPTIIVRNNYIESIGSGINIASIDFDASKVQIGTLQVHGNKIRVYSSHQNSGLVIGGVNCPASAPGEVYNNMVTIESPTYSVFSDGVRLVHNKNINFYHNSISMFGGPSNSHIFSTLLISRTQNSSNFQSSGTRIFNNIISNTSDGYLIQSEGFSGGNMFHGNYNNYYTTGSKYFYIDNTVGALDSAAWTNYTYCDSNSVWGNPNFLNPLDLHFVNSPANNAGLPLGINHDIDGDVRSPISPDIGADEYSPCTYRVKLDLRLTTADPNGVHITGNFQGWQPDSTPMNDSDGDSIYEYTINAPYGDTIEYKFINGNSWNDEETVPTACQFGNSQNRGFVMVNSIDSANAVCFSACDGCNVGLDEFDMKLNVYPNPSEGVFTVERSRAEALASISVINPLGQSVLNLIWPVNETQLQIPMEHYPSGIYSLRIRSSKGLKTLKILIQ